MIFRFASVLRALRNACRDRRGITAMVVGFSVPVIVGVASMGVDYALVIAGKTALQANADAAALAGAQTWSASGGTANAAQTTAQTWYSSHPVQGVTVTSASASTQCLTTYANVLPSCSSSSPNVVKVTETGTVNTYMWRFFGIDAVTISTSATAGKSGGGSVPLNVVIVIDATASMGNTTDDTGCAVPGYRSPTKFECALYGAQTIMKQLIAAQDNVGLLVFPGTAGTSTNQTWTPPCSGSYTSPVPYRTSNIAYQIANTSGATNSTLDNAYNSGVGTLTHSDPLVKAVGDFASSTALAACLQARGGEGTYYAEILAKATSLLTAQTNGYQNVIIMLSDGGSSATSSDFASGAYATYGPSQCNQAVQQAYNAANSHSIWVYSIAYDSNTTSGCPTYTSGHTTTYDTNTVSASTTAGVALGTTWTPCLTMQAIASDPTKFFSTSSGCRLSTSPNSYSSVNSAFQQVAGALGMPRLVQN